MAVDFVTRFPSRWATAEEAHEPFQSALQRELGKEGTTRLLVYTPPLETSAGRSAASVLAVTREGWLRVMETADGGTLTTRCDFEHTLLVELTIILLYGHLRIAFAAEDTVQSVIFEFNAVREQPYRQAVWALLDGIRDATPGSTADNARNESLFSQLPLEFRYVLRASLLPGEQLLAVAHWPATLTNYSRWFQRELAPAAMLALTDRLLMVISDETTRSLLRIGGVNKYGAVVTYCPVSRLADYTLEESGPVMTLSLRIQTGSVATIVPVQLPAGYEAPVVAVVQHALQQQETSAPARP
jgi:transposase InsO family protein